MKIAATDEYGLRILLRIAREGGDGGLSIPQLSEKENMSAAYVGKITRQLRMGGLIKSNRGKQGGYVLAKQPGEITVAEAIRTLDGPLFDDGFCNAHDKDSMKICTNSVDCSIRSLWKILQYSMDQIMANITLKDLCSNEQGAAKYMQSVVDNILLQES